MKEPKSKTQKVRARMLDSYRTVCIGGLLTRCTVCRRHLGFHQRQQNHLFYGSKAADIAGQKLCVDKAGRPYWNRTVAHQREADVQRIRHSFSQQQLCSFHQRHIPPHCLAGNTAPVDFVDRFTLVWVCVPLRRGDSRLCTLRSPQGFPQTGQDMIGSHSMRPRISFTFSRTKVQRWSQEDDTAYRNT